MIRLTKRTAWLVLCTVMLASTVPAQDDAASQQYFTGNALYNRKMYKLAIEEYKLFLAAHPNHAKATNARMGMALSHYALGDYAAAEPLLKQLVTQNTGDVEQLRLLYGEALLKLKKPGPAEQQFAALTSSADESIRSAALVGVLETRYAQKKWKQVIESADVLLKIGQDKASRSRTLYQSAYASYQLKQFKDAVPRLEELGPMVKGTDLEHQVSFLLAESHRMTGDLAKAVTQYRAAAAGFKGKVAAEISYRLGSTEFRRGNYSAAIAALGAYLAAEPDGAFSGDAYLYLGRSHIEQKQLDKAAQYLDALCAGTKKVADGGSVPVAEAVLWRARIHSRAGEYDKAAAFIGTHLPKLAGNKLLPDLLFDQANSFVASGDYKGAAAALKTVLADPKWPQANDALRLQAISLHHTGDFAGSLAVADKFMAAYSKDPLIAEAAFVRAEDLFFMKKADAEEAYASYLASYPKGRSVNAARMRLVQIHHRAGKWDKALEAAAPFVTDPPEGDFFSQLTFMVGDSHFRLGHWSAATANLSKFLATYPVKKADGTPQDEPNADAAAIELALAQMEQGNTVASIKGLEQLAAHCRKSKHLPLALSELGRLHYEAGEYPAARKAFEDFIGVAPGDELRPTAECYLGWIALSEKKDAEAAQHFEVVTTKYPASKMAPEAFLQLGLVQVTAKKYAEASKTLSTLLAKYPEHPRKELATFSLGISLARLKNWQGADPHFRTIVDRYPKSEHAARAMYELAWCSKGKQDNKGAIEWYRRLIKSYPGDKLVGKVKTELAELAFDAGDYDEVINQLKGTVATLKDSRLKEQATYRLGTAYFNKGASGDSAKLFDSFVASNPKSEFLASAHFQAGESYMKLKETEQARDHFLAASKVAEIDAALRESTLIRLGETQGLTSQWKESGDTYGAFVTAYPKSKWVRNARFGHAWALEKQKEYVEAIAAYEKVIDPGKDEFSARAQFQIGECLFELKKYDEAIRALIPVQIAYRYEDWAAKSLLETGRIMEAKGDKQAAMDQFKEVIRKYPKHNAAVVAKQRLDALRIGGM